MSRDAFGPNLRRVRIQRQIALEAIAEATKVPVHLLTALESNDLSDWPVGVFARSYVRQYAIAIGVDPDATVDEFCRWFPEGDRRAERLLREHAEIVDHDLAWSDELPVEQGDRRNAPPPVPAAPASSSVSAFFVRVRRGLHKA